MLAAESEEGIDSWDAFGAESEEGEGALVAEFTNKDGACSSRSSSNKMGTFAGAAVVARAPTETNWLLWDCLLSSREASEGFCSIEVRGRGACGG